MPIKLFGLTFWKMQMCEEHACFKSKKNPITSINTDSISKLEKLFSCNKSIEICLLMRFPGPELAVSP